MAVQTGTRIAPDTRPFGAKACDELGAFFYALTTRWRLPLLAALIAVIALQFGPARAGDDPDCTQALIPPCKLIGNPGISDHSGNHDHEFFWILYNAYADEWNKMPPDDPNAPLARSPRIAAQPQTSPPFPFVDWPMGTSQVIGASIPNSIDSPLMKALIGGTPFGKPMEDAHVQIYGWLNFGGNVSTAHGFLGNAPVAYANTPDTLQLDQAVVYIERVPDTVQKDHLDWGFRIAPIYGENYRYTTGYGFFSNQLVYDNHWNGFDMPMAWLEGYVPWVAQGMTVRVGRYISIPDIEAQLAPNNYMYTHSLAYATDNYTNTGVATSIKVSKNWLVQFAISSGTETFPWQSKFTTIGSPVTIGGTTFNPYQGPRDPGTQPSFTGCLQYETDSGGDHAYLCTDGLNNGQWGYNNLQWFGGTYYHKFNDVFHVSAEVYYEFQRGVWNKNYTGPGFANNPVNPFFGTPFYGMTFGPNEAQCAPSEPTCRAAALGSVVYWAYRLGNFDDITFRNEYFDDFQGQRFGFVTRYLGAGFGWQHWFGPQVEVRPEVDFYRSIDTAAFSNGTQSNLFFAGCDIIFHF